MNFNLEKDNVFLIIMPYYNRPEIVKDALNSIRKQKYKNWKIAFIDDGSDVEGKNVVENFFNKEELQKTSFYNTYDTREIKNKRKLDYAHLKGSHDNISGAFPIPKFNQAMNDHNFDIAFFLCDDDLLYDDYLENLNLYYQNNPEVMYSYSNVVLFDRRYQKPEESNAFKNRFTKRGLVRGYFNLDTTQVSWRSQIFKKDGVKFNEDMHYNFDAEWYEILYQNYGLCHPNFLISQYKDFDINAFNL